MGGEKNMDQQKMLFGAVLQTHAAQAALWKVLSCTCFAVISGLVHVLTRFPEKLPPCEIAFFQTGLAALFLWLFWFWRSPEKISLALEQSYLAYARAFCLAAGTTLWFTALKYLPLADIAAFKLLSPLIVILGACLFLKERLSPQRLLVLGGCLVGAGFLFQKEFAKGWQGDTHTASWAIFLPLLALLAFATSSLLAKRLLKKDSPQKVTFSLLILTTPLLGLFSSLDWVTPSASHFFLLFLMGILSSVAYYTFNKALELADLTYLMPFGLTRFIVSTFISCVIFGESLSIPLLGGAIIIVWLSFWLLRSEARQELSFSSSQAIKS